MPPVKGNTMRTIIIVLFLVVAVIVNIPIWLILKLISLLFPKTAIAMQRVVQAELAVVGFLSGAKVTVIGRENLPKEGAVLFAANHRSFFDVVLAYPHMKTLTTYAAKKEFSHIPVFSWNLRFLRCVFIDRKDLRQGVRMILKAADMAKDEGYSVFIFPEGSRATGEDPTEFLPFHTGSFEIAKKAGIPVIPVSFNNTEAIWEKHRPWVRSAHVVIEYGAPVDTASMDKKELRRLGQSCEETIHSMVEKNRSLV